MSVSAEPFLEGGSSRGGEVRIRPGEFARRVDVSKQQVYRWIYSGKLRASMVGRAWFIPVSELTEFFERESA
jgi:excisionase family DNA binding protein